ncbi:aminopeptidase [Brachybacterium ginsengisoli]|uniref:Aminopeptidase n=1 Tax=Brachybacterium ginsengisoli TaxID=1331682 RepID=A0A291GX93_9MICO|nr:M28 family peptidase [Brachybacterium ginsengisoli]ATG54752.1 aminopeptidase [Brachybacterium ginsengisoli]
MTSSHDAPVDADLATAPPHRRGLRLQAALLVALLLAAALAGVLFRGVPSPQGADAPSDVFSATRASQAAAPVVAAPRPVGSPAVDAAREELAVQLEALGFEITTQEGIGVRTVGAEATSGYVTNLVASRPGSDPTGTLVLATHIDSVPGAPGAADAGVGLAVILETVRALGPEAMRNDLVVLLVDGEERGLLGAEAFLEDGADQLTAPVVVLNHEARGISGRPMVTRAGGPMHEVIGAAPSPEFESFTDALFEIIPNDTDFTVYRDGGWWGMDMAIIDDAWAYHSAQDDAEHLDPGTLQHYGDLTLALTHDLGQRDLDALGRHAAEQPVQTTAPWGVVQVPPSVMTGLALLAPVLVLGAIVLRRRRGELSLLGTALGAATGLLVLIAGVLAAFVLWSLTAAATPEMLSQTTREPVRADPFLLAELLIAAAVVAAGWVLARLLISRAALLLGASLTVAVLLAVLGAYAPALGGSFILPAALAALGTLLAAVLPERAGLAVRAVALLPTGWMLGTQLHTLAEFGIASAAGGLAGTALIGLGVAAPLLLGPAPAGERPARRPHRLLIPLLPAVLTLGLVVAGTSWTLAAPEPTQERVTAHIDGESGETVWEVSGSTDWGRALDGTAAQSDLTMPTLETETLEDSRVRITITGARDASALTLSPQTDRLFDVAVDGVPVDADDGLDALQIHGLRAGQQVEVTARAAPGEHLTVLETAFDPSLAAGWTEPGAEVSLMQPRTEVTLTAAL